MLSIAPAEVQRRLAAAQLTSRLGESVAQHIAAVQEAVRALEAVADADPALVGSFKAAVEEFVGDLLDRPADHRDRLNALLGELQQLDDRDSRGAATAQAASSAAAANNTVTAKKKKMPKARLAALFTHRDAAYRTAIRARDYFAKLGEVHAALSLGLHPPALLRPENNRKVDASEIAKIREVRVVFRVFFVFFVVVVVFVFVCFALF